MTHSAMPAPSRQAVNALESPLSPSTERIVYRNRHLLQVAMPIGGIGSGCVCLNGQGGLQDFSLHHRPATTALPDLHIAADAAFALLRIKGDKPTTKLVEGPLPPERLYDQGLQTQGYRKGMHTEINNL